VTNSTVTQTDIAFDLVVPDCSALRPTRASTWTLLGRSKGKRLELRLRSRGRVQRST